MRRSRTDRCRRRSSAALRNRARSWICTAAAAPSAAGGKPATGSFSAVKIGPSPVRRGGSTPAFSGRSIGAVAGRELSALERVDVVAVFLVGAEDDAPASGRQRRAERRDAADAGEQVRQLRRHAAGELQAIDVGDPLPVGQEVQRPAVARPLRADVLRAVEPARFADLPGRDVQDRDPQEPGLQDRQLGW